MYQRSSIRLPHDDSADDSRPATAVRSRDANSLRLLLLAAALALSAASASQQTSSQGQAASSGQDPTGCSAACGHYFQCRGLSSQDEYVSCVQSCQAQQPDPNVMYQYAQLDCATAIQLVEGGGGGMGGGAGAGGGGGQQPGGTCTADCRGCMFDGTDCYFAHAAAGAGSAIHCDPCCCAPGGPAPRWD